MTGDTHVIKLINGTRYVGTALHGSGPGLKENNSKSGFEPNLQMPDTVLSPSPPQPPFWPQAPWLTPKPLRERLGSHLVSADPSPALGSD